MYRLLSLFACFALILSLGTGSMAHAMEPVAICVDVSASFGDHSEGDGDQVPADSEKGYPHHHAGCHGHHLATPAQGSEAIALTLAVPQPVALQPGLLADAAADPALRPPQA